METLLLSPLLLGHVLLEDMQLPAQALSGSRFEPWASFPVPGPELAQRQEWEQEQES